ncbi:hypothetical protein [Priestia megaterium]|nr:hypothetical protein [Priestia megaterium]
MRKVKQAVVASVGSAEAADVRGDVTIDPVAIGQAIADAAKIAEN